MAIYTNGAVTVSATAVKVCTIAGAGGGVIQNAGANDVYLGGPNVAATGAQQGVKIATGVTLTLPSTGPDGHDLYAISPTGSTVAFLAVA